MTVWGRIYNANGTASTNEFQIGSVAVDGSDGYDTDTMTVTALYLQKHCPNKTIVLTGAMIPYKFGSSDGLFNLGSALAFTQVLPTGVYIAMNGKIFEANKVQKNKERGEFEAL